MNESEKKPYRSFLDGEFSSEQKEYTAPTKLLDKKGILQAAGWARHMLFDYDRTKVKPSMRRKEWEYYLITNGRFHVLLSFCNVSFGGYCNASITDLKNVDKSKKYLGGMILGPSTTFLGGRNKYVLKNLGDVPHKTDFTVRGLGKPSVLSAEVFEGGRSLSYTTEFKKKKLECSFTMDIPKGHESITTVLPFENMPTRYFMTMKQNCMPCEGTFRYGDEEWKFSKEDTFCCVDWGRVNAPYRINWYWGNGATYLTDDKGVKHTFGFEITWGFGDESKVTETCLFYDGKAHKIGAVDVVDFPKGRFMEDWVFTSQDGRFEFTMKPFYDHFSDLNILAVRVKCHQVHGLWSGVAVLDDGTKLEIKDMYAFCEYVENRW